MSGGFVVAAACVAVIVGVGWVFGAYLLDIRDERNNR